MKHAIVTDADGELRTSKRIQAPAETRANSVPSLRARTFEGAECLENSMESEFLRDTSQLDET